MPLDEVARRGGVSIGTLCNHFPTRNDFYDAIFPERIAAVGRNHQAAFDAADPWKEFVGYLEGLFALQAEDRGLNDAMGERIPVSNNVGAACRTCLEESSRIIEPAHDAGRLRRDFRVKDLMMLLWATSQVIQSAGDWRRFVSFRIDGLKA
ncbi:TetR/AcrR family transcriptional regulator [Streptomyces sp. NBC_01446]|uniref:TetR/AcrR family transcriptional regulator n=1 Tax=Streptomyces sp. NBC_01446 TaxID=2903870 RepID=UPI00225A072D|nr:TetR/AcrR family transcriptional regulator [Streptomyces sp. NBC_01446]MCX4647049.1 TetR/AcrR family transcriptional regulator [Streptomyces sp. NBC_01446]